MSIDFVQNKSLGCPFGVLITPPPLFLLVFMQIHSFPPSPLVSPVGVGFCVCSISIVDKPRKPLLDLTLNCLFCFLSIFILEKNQTLKLSPVQL